MHDPHTPLPSLSVCLRQNFWMMTCWPSRKCISFTKTYMWCLCLDDPTGLTIYLFMRYLSLTTAPLSLICSLLCITGTWRLQTAFPNPLPAGLTMGFVKVGHVQNKNNNNLFFFLRQQFHFRIQTLAAQHHSSSFSTGHATSVTLSLVQICWFQSKGWNDLLVPKFHFSSHVFFKNHPLFTHLWHICSQFPALNPSLFGISINLSIFSSWLWYCTYYRK